MCSSKPKVSSTTYTAPPAPPSPAETATGFSSAGTQSADTSTITKARRGASSLRVDLNVPQGLQGGAGAYIP